jgi:hypothetical protein
MEILWLDTSLPICVKSSSLDMEYSYVDTLEASEYDTNHYYVILMIVKKIRILVSVHIR